MANTLNVDRTSWNGTRGMRHYNLTSDSTALTAASLIDISALGASGTGAPSSIKILSIQAHLYGNFSLTLLFDATTDEKITIIENRTSDISFRYGADFKDGPNKGWVSADITVAGWTGDLLITSTGLANLDAFDLIIVFEKSS